MARAERTTVIDGFTAECTTVAVGGETLALWRVADLERHVDRRALLAAPEDGVEPAAPPYWAHLWSGARILAAAVPAHAGRVLELGCGLGLPGLVAARRGARVTFVDRIATPLAFVRASLEANDRAADLVMADFTQLGLRGCFDLVLAAEILYDRGAFAAVASTLVGLLAPGGRALVSDARRIDTRDFDDALTAAGLRWRTTEHACREEGLPVGIRLLEVTRTLPPQRAAG